MSLDFIGGIERGVQSPFIATLFRIGKGLRVELQDLVQARTENAGDEFETLCG